MPTALADFPALTWLGYSLNMIKSTPIDINSVARAILKDTRLIELDPRTRQYDMGGIIYDIPRNIIVAEDVLNVTNRYVTYQSGTNVIGALQADPNLASIYLALKGGVSTMTRTFLPSDAYALFSFNADIYATSIRNYATSLNEEAFLNMLKDLPLPFTSTPEIIQKYQEFFDTFGSHVIVGASYGARYQMMVWTANTQVDANNFKELVTAAFNGIPSQGAFDPDIKDTDDYKTFEKQMQRLVVVRGGDESASDALRSDPTNKSKFDEWSKNIKVNPEAVNLQTIELWNLMRDSGETSVVKAAGSVQDAYDWIMSHPQKYRTSGSFTIHSSWGEVGLLTPAAILLPLPTPYADSDLSSDEKEDSSRYHHHHHHHPHPHPKLPILFTQSRIKLGTELSHKIRRFTVEFEIMNDGAPVDLYISHGSDAERHVSGSGSVTFAGETYTNDHITEDSWNTEYFYRCPVGDTLDSDPSLVE